MLTVRARPRDGEWRDVPNYFSSDHPRTADGLLRASYDAAEEYPEVQAVLDTAERYLRANLPGLGAFGEWAGEAVEQFPPSEGLGLRRRDDSSLALLDGSRTLAVVWESPDWVVVPVRENDELLEFEYLPDRPPGIAWSTFELRGDVEERHVLLDWQGYFGAGTFLTLGRSVLRRTGAGARRVTVHVAETTGVMIGKVVTRVGRSFQLDNDPLYDSRLRLDEETWPEVAERCPQLTAATSLQTDSCIVFVHGTVSCGIRSLAQLPPFPSVPVLRYEHKTFGTVSANAKELKALVGSLDVQRLLLVGHSRGGLVARRAKQLLDLDEDQREVDVWTFGTPHAGTPLVDAEAPIAAFYMLGAINDPDTPLRDAAGAAFSYLARPGAPPPGIEAMRPNGEFLEMLNQGHKDEPWLTAYGAAYDPKEAGVGAAFRAGLVRAAFGSEPNDLVVGTASATSAGTAKPLEQPCSHSRYFSDASVQDALGTWQ